MAKHTPTTVQVASRVNSATAKKNGGKIPANSPASRLESAAQRNSVSGRRGVAPKSTR